MIPLEEHVDEQSLQEETTHVTDHRQPAHFPEHAVHLIQELEENVVGAEQHQNEPELLALVVEGEVSDGGDVENTAHEQEAQDDIEDQMDQILQGENRSTDK